MKGEGTGLSPGTVYPGSCVDQGHPYQGALVSDEERSP